MTAFRSSKVYQGATVMRTLTLRVPAIFNVPNITLTLFDGMASHGYRTGYSHVPQRWLQVTGGAQKRPKVWRYSGARFDKAETHWLKIVRDLTAEGCELAQPTGTDTPSGGAGAL